MGYRYPYRCSIILQFKLTQIGFVFSHSPEFIFVDDIPYFIEERVSGIIIIVCVVIQYAVAVYINISGKHELQVVFKIYDISDICQETIAPACFIEHTNMVGYLLLPGPEKEKLGVAVKEFFRIIFRE